MLLRRSTLPLPALFLFLAFAAAPAAAQTKALGTPPAADQTSSLDLMPLKKALAPLAGNGLLEVQTSFLLTGSQGGTAVTLRKNIHILARRPGSFRAEISMIDKSGTTQKKFLVVSDGKRVWTYRPEQRTYSVVTRQAFKDAENDMDAMGMVVYGFFFGRVHSMPVALSHTTQENSASVLRNMTASGLNLTSKAQSVNGVDYIVYQLLVPKQDMTVLFYVDTRTNTLKRLESTGTTDGTQVALQDKLTLLRVPASVPADTFTWTPPPGAKKSAAVTVAPF